MAGWRLEQSLAGRLERLAVVERLRLYLAARYWRRRSTRRPAYYPPPAYYYYPEPVGPSLNFTIPLR